MHVQMDLEKSSQCDLLFQLVVSPSNRATQELVVVKNTWMFPKHNLFPHHLFPICKIYQAHTLRPTVQLLYIPIIHCMFQMKHTI